MACSSCSSVEGTPSFAVGSLDLSISLGRDSTGNSAGYYYLHLDQLCDAGVIPPPLQLASPYAGSGNGVSLPNGDIATISNAANGLGYTVWFKNSTGSFLSYTSLSCASTNLTNNTITIVSATGDPANTQTSVFSFFSSSPNQWTWAKQQGNTLETLAVSLDTWGNETTVITVSDTNYVVATVTTNIYANLANGGRTLVLQTLGTGAAARTTQRIYDPNTGLLTYLIQSTGYWVYYQYDGSGELTQKVSQFGDNPISTATSPGLNRETQISYNGTTGSTSTIDYLLGTEIARADELHAMVAPNVEQVTAIQYTNAASTNGALISVLWRTTASSGATNAWDTLQNRNPDGTVQFYGYSDSLVNGLTNRTTTLESGAPNVNWSGIADGTVTTTVTGSQGQMLSSTTQDQISQITTSQDTYSYSDPLNRSYTVTHLDGTQESVVYQDCCDITATIDRDGVVTTNLLDTAKRPIGTFRLGIMQTNRLDAAGNVLLTFRVGTDGSSMLLDARAYDTAGQLIADTNGLLGVTTYSWATNSSGQTVYTAVNPDLGTVITTNHADGTVLGTGGTAAQQTGYLYGVDPNYGPFTVTQKTSAAGSTNEWTASYTDMLGRDYRTTFASGTNAAVSSYNNLGQKIEEVDSDKVTRLYGYDAKGGKT
jgi:hypothetical protein